MAFLKIVLLVTNVLLCAPGHDAKVVGMPGYASEIFEPLDLNLLKSGGGLSQAGIRKALIPFYVEEVLDVVDKYPQAVKDILYGVENEVCKGHVLEWLARVKWNYTFDPEEDLWVLQMFDAWGKPPEGLLSGHVNALGDFDECLDITVSDLKLQNTAYPDIRKHFEGRYCNSFFTPYDNATYDQYFNSKPTSFKEYMMESLEISGKKAVSPGELIELIMIRMGVLILPSMGICFPNSCTQPDIQLVMMNSFDLMYKTFLNNSIPRDALLWPAVAYCYEGKKPDYDAADISVITLLLAILALCLFASLVDIALNRGLEKPPRRGLAFQYLNSFSLYTNIPRWMNTRPSADDLGCLHGIRFISTSWVILAHTWYVITFVPYWNSVDVKKLHENWMILTILNSTISVDTFFVLSGLLVAYNVLKLLHKTKGKLNIPMFYLHRYLRLTPVYAILIGCMATLVPYMGRGPYWFIMDRWGSLCENNWWTNMLYVNNFVNTSWLCQGEAWYLANDMQFYIVSPFILYPIYRWETIGLIILAGWTILSSLSPALLVHFLDTVPTTIGTRDSQEWFLEIYIKPYARIQTYLVGIWLGWLLFKTKGKRVHIPFAVVLLLWIIAAGICLSVLWGIQPWFDPTYEIPKVEAFFYAGFSRFGWAVSVSWVIFACVKGYGWIVNDFLSYTAFIPLGRLCYCVFLVSLHLQMVLHMQFKQPIGYSSYTMVNFFFGHLVMSFLVGFVFTLTIETPFMQIEKLIFEGGGRKEGSGPAGNAAVSGLPPGSQGTHHSQRNGIYYNSSPPDLTSNGEEKSKQDKEN